MAKLDQIPLAELEKLVEARRAAYKSLHGERKALVKRLAEIDKQLGTPAPAKAPAAPKAVKAPKPAKTVAAKKPVKVKATPAADGAKRTLADYVTDALRGAKGAPISSSDIVAAVSASHPNPSKSLATQISNLLKTIPGLTRVSRGVYQYVEGNTAAVASGVEVVTPSGD